MGELQRKFDALVACARCSTCTTQEGGLSTSSAHNNDCQIVTVKKLSVDIKTSATVEQFRKKMKNKLSENAKFGEETIIYQSCGHVFCGLCQREQKCQLCGAPDYKLLSDDPNMSSLFSILRSLQLQEVLDDYKKNTPIFCSCIYNKGSGSSDLADDQLKSLGESTASTSPKKGRSKLASPVKTTPTKLTKRTSLRVATATSAKDESSQESMAADQVMSPDLVQSLGESTASTSPKKAKPKQASHVKTTPPKLPERTSLRVATLTSAKDGSSQESMAADIVISPDLVKSSSRKKTAKLKSPSFNQGSATPKRKDFRQRSPRSFSLQARNTPLKPSSAVKKLAKASLIRKRNKKGETELHLASKRANLAQVRELLLAGADPNAQDNNKWTPLHEVVDSGNVPIMLHLIEGGAVVDACGGFNQTPLFLAVHLNKIPVAKALLNAGADPLARDLTGSTPWSLANAKQNAKEWTFLLEAQKMSMPLRLPPGPEIILLDVNLTAAEKDIFEQLASNFSLRVVANTYKDAYDANHFIISSDSEYDTFNWSLTRTMAKGAFIVKASWMLTCIEQEEIVDIKDYLVTPAWLPGLAAVQENRSLVRPGLFSGCHVLIGGPKSKEYTFQGEIINISDIISFVRKADGAVIGNRVPDPDAPDLLTLLPYHASKGSPFERCSYLVIYLPGNWQPPILYNMKHFKCLPFEWLMRSIKNFSFAPYESGAL